MSRTRVNGVKLNKYGTESKGRFTGMTDSKPAGE